ncbi:hypothetical protein Cgig2_021572 [Carnegiea gigantea]|uniref:Glycosyltransferase 61 catalytic domain-containing protein n=1 Tax=Carnegiea gigantea TaxID=171969 RepID=A0A9Q1JT78_9CARY|nr:hypothetical protein Cgig2_021572 [Carnegiea gigantea]
MDENILAWSLSKLAHRRFAIWAFLGVLLIAVSLFTVLKPYNGLDLPLLTLHWSRGINLKMLSILGADDDQKSILQSGEVIQPKKFEPFLVPICNFSEDKSDFCEIKGDIRIQGNSSSIFFTSPQIGTVQKNNTRWTIKLYARKTDKYAMAEDEDLLLKPALSDQEMPRCTVNHTIPAVVFSGRGYTGNFFHDFSDVMIPLYLTAGDFNREVQFLFEKKHRKWWINKYSPILKALSTHEIIELDNDQEIRCFKNALIGLKSHKDFDIDPEKPPFGNSLRNFTKLVRRAYSLQREKATKLTAQDKRKPRLLIISRKGTRLLVNEDEVAAEAQSLGFDVEAMELMNDLRVFSKRVNSFDVIVGVHGAGLTNMVFLPENAVLIQVVPLGLEWLAKAYFEHPAKDMNIKYLEYKINKNESSLIEQYPIDHPVITDPSLLKKEGYGKFKSIYLDSQNVRLDVSRFRGLLLEALQLVQG